MSNKIIAVGYTIPTNDDIINFITSQMDEATFEKYRINDETKSGVYYDACCPGVGKSDAKASQQNMSAWYNSKKTREFNGVIWKVWIIEKPYVIVCEVIIGSDRLFSFIAKPNDRFQTTCLKKEILSGKHSAVECTIKITASPYIHYLS